MEIKVFKNRSVNLTEPIRVYRNLTRKGVIWSMMQKGKVVAHCESITLKNCVCLVNHKAQKRIRETKKREVHAYIEGYLTEDIPSTDHRIQYNPFKYDYFFTAKDNGLLLAVNGSEYINFSSTGVKATNIF